MKSRSDIAEGKPLGVWFIRSNRMASLVSLTRNDRDDTVTGDESNAESGETSESGGDDNSDRRTNFFNT